MIAWLGRPQSDLVEQAAITKLLEEEEEVEGSNQCRTSRRREATRKQVVKKAAKRHGERDRSLQFNSS